MFLVVKIRNPCTVINLLRGTAILPCNSNGRGPLHACRSTWTRNRPSFASVDPASYPPSRLQTVAALGPHHS